MFCTGRSEGVTPYFGLLKQELRTPENAGHPLPGLGESRVPTTGTRGTRLSVVRSAGRELGRLPISSILQSTENVPWSEPLK